MGFRGLRALGFRGLSAKRFRVLGDSADLGLLGWGGEGFRISVLSDLIFLSRVEISDSPGVFDKAFGA